MGATCQEASDGWPGLLGGQRCLSAGKLITHTRTAFSLSEHLAYEGQNRWSIHRYFEIICGRSMCALQLTVALSKDPGISSLEHA